MKQLKAQKKKLAGSSHFRFYTNKQISKQTNHNPKKKKPSQKTKALT